MMLGPAGGSGMSVEQKKRLLWGGKKVEANAEQVRWARAQGCQSACVSPESNGARGDTDRF
jgi:hypothetical protein